MTTEGGCIHGDGIVICRPRRGRRPPANPNSATTSPTASSPATSRPTSTLLPLVDVGPLTEPAIATIEVTS